MSEREESVLRSQTILLMTRNYEKSYVIKRVLKRFMSCIKFGNEKVTKAKKKTRQGQGRGTKFSTKLGSKRFKKKYRGQGK